jgi:transcriptional regulator with XRE-family HTH domain
MVVRNKASEDFAERLATTMEMLNYSRVALARELSIDKAVVSRWLAGENKPTEHNLTRLTELVRRTRPNFTLADWRGSTERFTEAMDRICSIAESEPSRLVLRGLQAPSMPRHGQQYFGVWAGFHSSVVNDGAILLWGMQVYSDPLGMRFQTCFGSLGGEGPAALVGGRLHLLTEVAPLHDRLAYLVFNAVHALRADLLDGLIAVPADDADGTPTATLLRAVRIGDAPTAGGFDFEAYGDAIRRHNRDILRAIRTGTKPIDAVAGFAPRPFIDRVLPRMIAAHANGEADHVLRMSAVGRPSQAAIEAAQTGLKNAFGLSDPAAMPPVSAALRIAEPA